MLATLISSQFRLTAVTFLFSDVWWLCLGLESNLLMSGFGGPWSLSSEHLGNWQRPISKHSQVGTISNSLQLPPGALWPRSCMVSWHFFNMKSKQFASPSTTPSYLIDTFVTNLGLTNQSAPCAIKTVYVSTGRMCGATTNWWIHGVIHLHLRGQSIGHDIPNASEFTATGKVNSMSSGTYPYQKWKRPRKIWINQD